MTRDDTYTPTYGVEIQAAGDSRLHTFSFSRDLEYHDDKVSQVVTYTLTERDAEDLYWWLIQTIPQLRNDRR